MRVAVGDGTVALEARDCALTDLLAVVAARTGVRVVVSDGVPPRSLTLSTRPRSVEATLRELLRGSDLFLLYTTDSGPEERLAAVWAYPRGGARFVEPVPAEQWASTRDLQSQLTEWNPDLRGRAIEELIARRGDAALPQVFEALSDPSADLRQRALDAALAEGLELPLEQLHALVLNDPAPEVRVRALQALEARPDSASTIEIATNDPDVNVRREAQAMLTRADRAPR